MYGHIATDKAEKYSIFLTGPCSLTKEEEENKYCGTSDSLCHRDSDSQYPRETKDFESIFFPDDFFTHVDVKYIILSVLILRLKKKYSVHTCQYFTVEGYLTFNLHITFFNYRN